MESVTEHIIAVDLLETAAALATDRVVFPVRVRDKQPLTKWGHLEPGGGLVDTVRSAWRSLWHRDGTGIGMRTGDGLVVVDLDPRNCGAADPDAWLASAVAELPATLMARTGGGGRHLYFASAASLRSKPLAGVPGIDIKAAGGFVIVPPSPGYAWVNEGAEIAALPEWLEEAAQRRIERGPGGGMPADWQPFELREVVAEGGRNDYLARLGGYLLSQEIATSLDLEDWLQDFNAQACKPPLDPDEVATIAASIGRYGR